MPLTAGSVPSMLTAEEVIAISLQYAEENESSYPVTALFGVPQPKSYEDFTIEINRLVRGISSFSVGPVVAQAAEARELSKIVARALYQAKLYNLPANYFQSTDVAILAHEAGMSVPISLVGLAEDARLAVINGVLDLVKEILRTFEKLAIQTLTEASFNITMRDGSVSTSVPWGLQTKNAGVNWGAIASDITKNFADNLEYFSLRAGGPPDKILISPTLDAVVNQNTGLLEFLNRFPGWVRDPTNIGADIMTPLPDRTYEVQRIESVYDVTGTPTRLFPALKMVMVKNPSMALKHFTVRTPDNNMQGGMFARTVEKLDAPRGMKVEVTHNGLPAIVENKMVLAIDLSA